MENPTSHRSTKQSQTQQYTEGGGTQGQRNANGGEKRRQHQSSGSQQNRRGILCGACDDFCEFVVVEAMVENNK